MMKEIGWFGSTYLLFSISIYHAVHDHLLYSDGWVSSQFLWRHLMYGVSKKLAQIANCRLICANSRTWHIKTGRTRLVQFLYIPTSVWSHQWYWRLKTNYLEKSVHPNEQYALNIVLLSSARLIRFKRN